MGIFDFFKSGKKSADTERKRVSIKEQLDTLFRLGIKPRHTDFIDWLCNDVGREAVESNPYSLLLCQLGGEKEFGNDWEPLSNDVYCFNTEIIEDSESYRIIFTRLAALSNGLFNISSILSSIDHASKWVSISFCYNNKRYNWRPQYNYEWFDYNIICRINSLLKSTGSSEYFYTSSPEQNLCVLFASADKIKEINRLVTFKFEVHFLNE